MWPNLHGTDSMWTIYSIGSPSFMYKVFNAIAMLGDGGVLMRMGQIGFLIGLFVLIYKIATAAGSLTDLRQSLLAGVIFAAMFGTTTSVKLIGMVPSANGQNDVRIVDHVPWGIAAVGGVISGAGVYLTRRMETAFRDGDAIPVTQGGFGRTAEILASVRSLSMPSIPNALPAYSYYRRSMLAYLQDCAVRARQFEVMSDHTLAHAPDPLSAIHYDNGLQRTRSWLNTLTEQGEDLSCPNAHALLTAKAGDLRASLDPVFQQRFGGNTDETLQRAFASVAADSAEAAQRYMAGAMINALWMDAASGSSFGAQGSNNALMIRAALEQQRVQWAAEESIFLRTMRPMIGYFESFFYALSPFIAFLIGLGAMGLRMIVKYVSLTLAVSLWLPILAITNLYQITTLEDFFQTQERIATAAGSGPFSLSNNLALVDQATGAVALASMIAAATPMLTLTLLFGGAVAATSLFSRLQGQDHINEKVPAPDPLQVGSIYQASPAYVGNDAYGTRPAGQDASALSFNVSEQLQQSVRSLSAKAQQASSQATETWAQVMSRNESLQTQFSNALERQLTDSTALSQNAGYQRLIQAGYSHQQAVSAIESYADQSRLEAGATLEGELGAGSLFKVLGGAASRLSGAAQANGAEANPGQRAVGIGQSGGLGSGVSAAVNQLSKKVLPNIRVSAQAGLHVSETGTETTSEGHTFTDASNRSRTEQTAVQLAMQHAAAEAMRDTRQHLASLNLSRQDSRQLSDSLTALEQSSKAYEEGASNAAQFGAGQTLNALAVSRHLADRPERAQEVEQLARSLGGDAAYQSNLAAIARGDLLGMPIDAGQQGVMASILTLAGIGPGAQLTENTPGLAGLDTDRREALSYALGASAGLGQSALRAEALEHESLTGANASAARNHIEAVRPTLQVPEAGEIARGVEAQQAAVNVGLAMATEDQHGLQDRYADAQQVLANQAEQEDSAQRVMAAKPTLDRVEAMNTDLLHRAGSAAFNNPNALNLQTAPLNLLEQGLRDRLINDSHTLDERLQPYRDEPAAREFTGPALEAYAAGRLLHAEPFSRDTPETASYFQAQLAELRESGTLDPASEQKLKLLLPVFGEPSQAERLRLQFASPSAPAD